MAGFGEDEIETFEPVRLRSLVMYDAQRMTLYATMAGLVDAGLSFEQASEIVAAEFESVDDVKSAQSVRLFFGAVDGARKAGEGSLRAAATKAFGVNFICPEEMALLMSLVSSPRPECVLETASRLLEIQARTRAASATGSHQRFAG